jgi:hypothetical protein
VPIPTLPALVTMSVVLAEEVEPMTNMGAVPIAFVGFMER